MRRRALDLLACPACGGSLALDAGAHERDGHVFSGTLRSACGASYPVAGGVPRLLPPSANGDPLAPVKAKTIENFGFEWTTWGRYGWTDGDQPTDEERATFWRKTLLTPDELRGKVALDGGCGNGRYAFFAAEHARDVIAVDLGPGVGSAFANLAAHENVHVVQGDLFHPPVQAGVVDVIFSIGVLMHTGDARLATERLAARLPAGGSITVHLYHRGNAVYELNDALLRQVTTRLPISTLMQLSRGLSHAGVALERRGLLGYANQLLRLHTDDTQNFDWYAAPVASHHTYPEVFAWFADLGLDVIGDHRASSVAAQSESRAHRPGWRGVRRWLGRQAWRDWALTVRGRKRR